MVVQFFKIFNRQKLLNIDSFITRNGI